MATWFAIIRQKHWQPNLPGLVRLQQTLSCDTSGCILPISSQYHEWTNYVLDRDNCQDTNYSLRFSGVVCSMVLITLWTRSSAGADNRLDAFSGQSRSTNMVPFHMLYIASYCAIVTLSLRRAVLRYSSSKNFMTLKWGSKVTQGHWEWYHSIDCVWFPISVL